MESSTESPEFVFPSVSHATQDPAPEMKPHYCSSMLELLNSPNTYVHADSLVLDPVLFGKIV